MVNRPDAFHHRQGHGHFLFGRWVRADAAAVFAALVLLGFLSTLDAAVAAFLLVTSLLLGRFFILPLLRLAIDDSRNLEYKVYGYIKKVNIFFMPILPGGR
jgi:hypothetical protein